MNTMSIYHFVDPDLGVEIVFEEKGATEKAGVAFEIGDWATCRTLVLGVEENFMQSLFLFFFLVTKVE